LRVRPPRSAGTSWPQVEGVASRTWYQPKRAELGVEGVADALLHLLVAGGDVLELSESLRFLAAPS
jgi:hypothetical protein